jgi:histidine phosphotransferase ChpT
MATDTSSITALIASRICHDLATPIQALTTALDVLESDNSPEMRECAINLLRESTNNASAKIEFMRAVFGSITAGNGTAMLEELKRYADRFFASQKPNLNWEITEAEAPRSMARVILNLILVAADSLPRGGDIIVKSQKNAEILEFSVRAAGPRVMLKPALRAALQGKTPEDGFDARSIGPYLGFLTATEHKIQLAAREDEASLTFLARMRLNPAY